MKIAIAGFGIEGKASYNYWNTPGNELTIVDEREELQDLPQGALTIFGEGAFSKLADFDLIVRSPSINPKRLPYGEKVWSATNEFFAKCAEKNVPIIGVTGTKGKGTTSSLITSILRAAGRTAHLVGNIGAPALEELSNIQAGDIVVYELSSFQLWDIEMSPHIAVVLPIEPDHLDVHASMDEYAVAKANIARYQSVDDVVIFNKNNQYSRQIAELSPAQKSKYPFDVSAYTSSLKLPGKHNEENTSAAIAVVRIFSVSDEAIHEGLSNFTGLPHRLKFVREIDGVQYYDDSIATTSGSALAAINSFEQPKVLLLGGHEKGGDYGELMRQCAEKDVRVIAYGANRYALKQLCDEYDVDCSVNEGGMASVVEEAAAFVRPGGVVILSPAAASFDMFKNYADRGDQFIDAVMGL